jgi:hypothetical protein
LDKKAAADAQVALTRRQKRSIAAVETAETMPVGFGKSGCEDCVFRVFLYSCCHRSNIFWSLSRKLHFDFGTSSSVLVKDDHLMQFVYVVDGKRLSSSHTASPELGV